PVVDSSQTVTCSKPVTALLPAQLIMASVAGAMLLFISVAGGVTAVQIRRFAHFDWSSILRFGVLIVALAQILVIPPEDSAANYDELEAVVMLSDFDCPDQNTAELSLKARGLADELSQQFFYDEDANLLMPSSPPSNARLNGQGEHRAREPRQALSATSSPALPAAACVHNSTDADPPVQPAASASPGGSMSSLSSRAPTSGRARPRYGETECPICYNAFSADASLRAINGCRHAYHSDCLERWAESALRRHTARPPRAAAPPALVATGLPTLRCPVCRAVPPPASGAGTGVVLSAAAVTTAAADNAAGSLQDSRAPRFPSP
ncbi:hypothetical protein HK405_004880, partial [Cladochytrium tenue]